jgi:WD40 repeat protein
MTSIQPTKIGRFTLRKTILHRGLTFQYQAVDQENGTEVALKELSPFSLNDPGIRAQYQTECQLIYFLNLPAVAPVIELFEENGRLYAVAPLMRGGSLRDRLAKGTLVLDEVLRILHRLAPTLDELHAAGVVHGNIIPDSILFDESGEAFLADFGLLRMARAAVGKREDFLIGSPGYLSPEHCQARMLTPACDLYMLGVVIYEALTGQRPFNSNSALGFAVQHLTAQPPDPMEINPDLPGWMNSFFLKALAKDPDQRFANTAKLYEAMQEERLPHYINKVAENLEPQNGTVPDLAFSPSPPSQSSVPVEEDLSTIKKRKSPLRWSLSIGVLILLGFGALFISKFPLDSLNLAFFRSSPSTLLDMDRPEKTTAPAVVQSELQRPSPIPTDVSRVFEPSVEDTAPASDSTVSPKQIFSGAASPTLTPTPDKPKTPTPISPTAEISLVVIRMGDPPPPVPPNHTVQYNDALIPLAIQYGVHLSELMGLNSLSCQSQLVVGSKIVLPARNPTVVHSPRITIDEDNVGKLELTHVIDCIKDVRAAAFSPDGKILAAASGNYVYLWEVDSWLILARLKGHQSLINNLVFSPNGEFLASGSEDATIRIWQVSDASLMVTLNGHTGPITGLAYAPGGQTLVSTSRDSSARVWKPDGSMIYRFSGYDTFSTAFSPDGQFLAIGYADSIRLYDTTEFILQLKLTSQNVVSRLSFSPDGKLLASNSALWHLSEARSLYSFDRTNEDITFTNDGQLLLIGRRAWKVSNGLLHSSVKAPLSESLRTANDWESFAWSADGGMVAWGNKDWLVILMPSGTGRSKPSSEIHTAGSGDNLYTVSNQYGVSLADLMGLNQLKCTSPIFESQHLVLPSNNRTMENTNNYPALTSTNVSRIDRVLSPTMTCVNDIGKVFFSGDGKMLLSGSGVWNISTAFLVLQPDEIPIGTDGAYNTQRPGQLMVFSPTESLVAIRVRKTIQLWNTSTGRLEKTFDGHKGNVSTLAFSADGRFLASGADSGEQVIHIWDVQKGVSIQSIPGFSVQRMVFSADNQMLLSQGEDTVRVWRLSDGRQTVSLQGIEGEAAFSSDGMLIAYASCIKKSGNSCISKLVSVYRVEDSTFVVPLAGITEDIGTIRFSPAGEKLFAVSGHGIRVWDVGSWRQLHSLVLPEEITPLRHFYLSIDGTLIFAIQNNGKLLVWSVSDGNLVYSKTDITIADLAVHPDNNMLAIFTGRKVELWAVK